MAASLQCLCATLPAYEALRFWRASSQLNFRAASPSRSARRLRCTTIQRALEDGRRWRIGRQALGKCRAHGSQHAGTGGDRGGWEKWIRLLLAVLVAVLMLSVILITAVALVGIMRSEEGAAMLKVVLGSATVLVASGVVLNAVLYGTGFILAVCAVVFSAVCVLFASPFLLLLLLFTGISMKKEEEQDNKE